MNSYCSIFFKTAFRLLTKSTNKKNL